MSPPGRAFVALVPPPEILAAADDRLAGMTIPGRRVPTRNWHVTLRFVGRVDETTYDRWVWSLSRIDFPSIRLRLTGMGAFPRASKATVLWVGLGSDRLDRLAAAVEEATVAAGLPPEERPFRAHMTLSRIRPPQDVRALLETSRAMEMGWEVNRFHVMAAVGSTYQIFDSFPLGARNP